MHTSQSLEEEDGVTQEEGGATQEEDGAAIKDLKYWEVDCELWVSNLLDFDGKSVVRRLLDSCDFTLAVVFWDGLANALRLTEFAHNSTTDSHTYTESQKR